MVEIDIGGGEARVAEQALHLLQRVAQDQPIALHRPHRQCGLAQSLLDQQSEHMDCEGVAKLVRADRQREAVLLAPLAGPGEDHLPRSEEHTSELQSLMRTSYAVFCLKKKKKTKLHV